MKKRGTHALESESQTLAPHHFGPNSWIFAADICSKTTMKHAATRSPSILRSIAASYFVVPGRILADGLCAEINHAMAQRMSRCGNCFDSAAVESLFGTRKSKLFHLNTFRSIPALKAGLTRHIKYYNNDRMKIMSRRPELHANQSSARLAISIRLSEVTSLRRLCNNLPADRMPTIMSNTSQRVAFPDGLRGWGALAVVLFRLFIE